MRIKTVPEDFVVDERLEYALAEGQYSLCHLTKRDMTTEDAVQRVANELRIPRKAIAYSGSKDRRAVTTQYITIRGTARDFSNDRLSLKVLGTVKEPLGLGRLQGNRFTIVCRELNDEELQPLKQVPNYFDEQRFSTMNADIGRQFVKGDFKQAVSLIQQSDRKFAGSISVALEESPNNFVGALYDIPRHTLLLYVHAYQSLLYNEVLTKYIRESNPDAILVDGPVPVLVPTKELENVTIPIIGFGSELDEPFASWYGEILVREGITQRDFVIRAIPFLTSEGAERDAFISVSNFSASPRESDELHSGTEKQTLRFTLSSGAYATMVVKCCYSLGSL